jgi:hypothetical protein
VADHPLGTAKNRRLGEPLPYQQPNSAKAYFKADLSFVSAGILFRAKNQMTFVLLTRSLCKNI